MGDTDNDERKLKYPLKNIYYGDYNIISYNTLKIMTIIFSVLIMIIMKILLTCKLFQYFKM